MKTREIGSTREDGLLKIFLTDDFDKKKIIDPLFTEFTV